MHLSPIKMIDAFIPRIRPETIAQSEDLAPLALPSPLKAWRQIQPAEVKPDVQNGQVLACSSRAYQCEGPEVVMSSDTENYCTQISRIVHTKKSVVVNEFQTGMVGTVIKVGEVTISGVFYWHGVPANQEEWDNLDLVECPNKKGPRVVIKLPGEDNDQRAVCPNRFNPNSTKCSAGPARTMDWIE
jgi:hypothetical protein